MTLAPTAARTMHPIVARITHWVNVVAMVWMVMSGMGIYNAHPILSFTFPEAMTLGGWLGGSTAWHFAVMWLLVGNGIIYILFGITSGYLRERLFPVRIADVVRDMRSALTGRLSHDTGSYNAVQKALYLFVLFLGVLMIASGLAIWKPVQFSWLAWLFGGFDFARVVHFIGMVLILGFVLIHVVMVILVPRTLLSMTVGRLFSKRSAGHG